MNPLTDRFDCILKMCSICEEDYYGHSNDGSICPNCQKEGFGVKNNDRQ